MIVGSAGSACSHKDWLPAEVVDQRSQAADAKDRRQHLQSRVSDVDSGALGGGLLVERLGELSEPAVAGTGVVADDQHEEKRDCCHASQHERDHSDTSTA